jgi:hypothetical protein
MASINAVGDVQVPEHDIAYPDRHTKEATHRRMTRWEPGGSGVGSEIVEADRDRVADQQAEDAVAVRKVTDQVDRGPGHAGVDKRFELAIASDAPDRRIAGIEQITGRLGHATQDHRKTQICSYGRIGTQQPPQTTLDAKHITRPIAKLPQQEIQLQSSHPGELQTFPGAVSIGVAGIGLL